MSSIFFLLISLFSYIEIVVFAWNFINDFRVCFSTNFNICPRRLNSFPMYDVDLKNFNVCIRRRHVYLRFKNVISSFPFDDDALSEEITVNYMCVDEDIGHQILKIFIFDSSWNFSLSSAAFTPFICLERKYFIERMLFMCSFTTLIRAPSKFFFRWGLTAVQVALKLMAKRENFKIVFSGSREFRHSNQLLLQLGFRPFCLLLLQSVVCVCELN